MCVRVLIADPAEDLLEIYRDYLTEVGLKVATVSSGQECLAVIERFRPQVLVLEPDMPYDWGNRILESMRRDSRLRRLPTIILSRVNGEPDGDGRAAPVRERYVKPLSLQTLAERIRQAADGCWEA